MSPARRGTRNRPPQGILPSRERRLSNRRLSSVPPAVARRLALLSAVLVAVALCAPRLGLGYFWDDYIFLTAGQANPTAFLLPNSTTIFYRPISMGIYFLLLLWLGPWGGVAGHVLNLALVGACVVLVSTLTAKVAGTRAGLLAGFAYAALSSVPSLVAWTTAAQDLLAIAFILAALHLRHSERLFPAFLAAGCAMFSKEPAMAMLPALVLWPWLLGRPPYRLLAATALCLGVVAIWAAVHPGVHAFLAHGFQSTATGYVRMQDPGRWASHLGSYLLTLFHLPWTGYPTEWPRDLTWSAVIAVVILGAGVWLGRGAPTRDAGRAGISWWRAAALASFLIFPPLLLDTALVGHWAPYYVSLPGMGSALLIGALLSKTRPELAAACLAVYVVLGVWHRGVHSPDTLAFTERNMVEASAAARTVEHGFRQTSPSLPHGARVYLSVAATGTLGIAQTMFEGQALRVWYGDPTIQTRTPWEYARTGGPEHLFYIGSSLEVVEVDLRTLESVAGGPPHDFQQYQGAVRSYAFGLAASGDTGQATEILLGMPAATPTVRSYNGRLAAMVLFAADQEAEALRILEQSAPIDSVVASAMAAELLLETKRTYRDLDVLRAFEIPGEPPSVYRRYMRWFQDHGFPQPALDFARKLQEVSPGDRESADLIRALGGQSSLPR